MRMMMAFDLTAEDVGKTLWWNPADTINPAGPEHIEEIIAGLVTLPPTEEFPAGGVIVSESQRIIPGNTLIGVSEESME